jgi:chromosomal replication initiation ATPase DnaA
MTAGEWTHRAIEALAQMFGLTRAAIIAHDRRASVVRVRNAVARILRLEGWSLSRIGRALHRDRTTVRHMVRSAG